MLNRCFSLLFVTSKFWHFLALVAGCTERKFSCLLSAGFGCLFLYLCFAAAHLRPLMEWGTGHVSSTQRKDQAGPYFLEVSGGSCGQWELLMMPYKWRQLKFSDGALLQNQQDSFSRGGWKKLQGIRGRSHFPWHPLLILGHTASSEAQNHLFFARRKAGFVFE